MDDGKSTFNIQSSPFHFPSSFVSRSRHTTPGVPCCHTHVKKIVGELLQIAPKFRLTAALQLLILDDVINLDKVQRKELAKALYDVGKLVLAALVIGQFMSGEAFRFSVFVIGLMIFAATFIIATMLNKGVE